MVKIHWLFIYLCVHVKSWIQSEFVKCENMNEKKKKNIQKKKNPDKTKFMMKYYKAYGKQVGKHQRSLYTELK